MNRRRAGGGYSPLFWFGSATLVHRIIQLEDKPVVTLGLLAAKWACFFLPDAPAWIKHRELRRTVANLARKIPSLRKGALCPAKILERHEWQRLMWGAVLHVDEWHLFFNSSSLLYKGMQLEPAMGKLRFGALVLELGLMSGVMLCLAFWAGDRVEALQPFFEHGYDYFSYCAVGFSGINFGLKTVLDYSDSGWQEISLGPGTAIPLPSKYAMWAELFLVQLVNPSASFIGHLCGIAAGLLHVHVTSKLLPWYWRARQPRRPQRPPPPGNLEPNGDDRPNLPLGPFNQHADRPRFYGGGRVGYRDD